MSLNGHHHTMSLSLALTSQLSTMVIDLCPSKAERKTPVYLLASGQSSHQSDPSTSGI